MASFYEGQILKLIKKKALTMRQIADKLGVTVLTVHRVLAKLGENGLIDVAEGARVGSRGPIPKVFRVSA